MKYRLDATLYVLADSHDAARLAFRDMLTRRLSDSLLSDTFRNVTTVPGEPTGHVLDDDDGGPRPIAGVVRVAALP